MKTPEAYFMDNVRLPSEERGNDMTDAEKAFLDKYVGVGGDELLESTPVADPRGDAVVSGMAAPEGAATDDLPDGMNEDEWLREQTEIQLVSFMVGDREFAMPITATQEVIKTVPVTKLPSAPGFIVGIINLRGRVTPLLRLKTLLGVSTDKEDRFIVVCRHKGLQVGLMINAVATMYRVSGQDIEWGLESHVGVNAEYLVGLLKNDDKLIGILSVDGLTHGVLKLQEGRDG